MGFPCCQFSRVSVPRPSPSSASAGLSSSKHNQKPQQTTLLSSCPPSVAGAPDTSSSSPPAAGAPQETVLPPSPSALALAEKHEEKKKDENLSDLPTKSEGGGEQGGEENKQKQAEDIPLLHDGASPSPSSGGAAAAVPSPHDHEKDSPLPNHVDDASPSSSCPQSPSPRGVIPLEGKVSHARPSSSSSPPSDDISPHEGENGARLSSDGKTQGEEEPSSSSPSLPALVITAKDQKDPHAPTDNPSHDKDDCSHTAGGAEKGKEERKKEDGDLPSSEDALKTKAEEASSPALIPLSPSTNGEKSSSSSAAAAAGGEEEEKGMVNEMGGMTDDTMMDACTYGEYSRGLAGSRGGGPGHMVDGKMSLDEVLDRKWKKLSSYMHEEQLFKAYSYLLLLEHQVDHRLTVLTTTLASSPPPPPPTDGNSSSLSGGPSGKTPPQSTDKSSSSSSSSSASPYKVEDSTTKESAGGGGASHAGVTTMSKRRYEEMKIQRELLLDFQRKLLTSQELENLRFVMIWAYQMLMQFHLEHLKQACEDPRLSFCESLSSLARSGSCASSQLSAFSSANLGGACQGKTPQGGGIGAGGIASSSSNHPGGHRSASTTPGNEIGGGEGERTDREDHEFLLASGGGGAGQVVGGGGGGASSSIAGGAPGVHTGNSGSFPERKISATKIRQGLRNMSRKMSLSRRGSFSKIGTMKKIITQKKVQDDEGWIREKGKYLDLAYRVEKDTSVSIKVRGKLPCRLFEVLSILNETDLAGTWAPFFKSAEREYQYTKASQLVRQVYDYPLLGSKETIMFCAGINALEEAGCVMIFCRSPPENVETFLGLPIPEKRKIQRIQSADLVFLLYPISEGKQTTLELYGNFHHGMRFVPMKIITFVVKKVVRGMFVSIARQCQQFETGPYKERVEKDKDFYTWMEEKIEEYVKQQKYAAFKIPAESISLASFNYEDFQD